MMFQAFVTGSRKYGIPKRKSDTDLVVRMSMEDYRILREQSDDPNGEEHILEKRYESASCKPLRFGKLNLIVCVTDAQYDCWFAGTQALLERKELINRDIAVKVFTALRRAAGLQK